MQTIPTCTYLQYHILQIIERLALSRLHRFISVKPRNGSSGSGYFIEILAWFISQSRALELIASV